MLLPGHALDRRALLLPHRGDVEQHVRLPVALLRLVRLEQEHRRGAEHLLPRFVPVCLRDDAGVLGEVGHRGMVVIINVLRRVREDEGRMDPPVDVHEPIQRLPGECDRVVAQIPELDVRHAEMLGRGFRLLPPFRLDPLERHVLLPPEVLRIRRARRRRGRSRKPRNPALCAARSRRPRARRSPPNARSPRAPLYPSRSRCDPLFC